MDDLAGWVAAEQQREAEETPWRAVAAAMVLAASTSALALPAVVSIAALLGWLR
ncbi:MAG TPA: hypothetical protein VJS19_01450 [Candidatus Dormibacteraeota bacterium]|nr:hypothetical protein [Candidatus Dormibacteraeota bacterium]